MVRNTVTVNTIVIKKDMKYNNQIVLTYKIEYPEFKSSRYRMSLVSINKYYKTKSLEYQYYLENVLYDLAVKQYQDSVLNGYPVRTFEALAVYTLTYNAFCIISLYFDRYEFTGGAHGNTIRSSETWNLQKCYPIKLYELFGCPSDYKGYITKQAAMQIKKNPNIYFENYKQLLAETFNNESFYCTPKGIVVFYQQYDIAPYSSGIIEFLIPYSNCVYDPKKTCFNI